jgi:hypothetical protein
MVRSSLPQDVEPGLRVLADACADVGRDPATLGKAAMLHCWAPGRSGDPPSWIGTRFGPPLTGAPEQIADVFRAFARAGMTHLQVVIWPHSLAGIEAFGPVLALLDRDG